MNQQVLNVRLVNNDVLGSVDDTAGTPTVIGLLKQTYNKLSTSTGNTSISLNILQNRVNLLENTVNGSETTNPPIEGLTARVSDLEDVTDEQTTNIQLNATNIDNLNTSYNTLNNSLNNISTGLTNSINTTNSNLSALADRVTSLDNLNDGRVKVAEFKLNVIENTVAGLVSDVQGTGGALDDIIDLQADVTTLQTDVTTLQNTVQGIHPGVGESTNQTGGERFNLYSNGNPVRNDASGDYSHAEGYLTVASGNYSHVEGSSNSATGESAHAEGSMTVAGGKHAHAEGYKTIASGNYAHAEGYTNSPANYFASGQGSHIEGYNSKATGTGCHAEGQYAYASGTSAHAEGHITSATGFYSHSGGQNTVANSACMTAIGRYNKTDSTAITNINRLLVVGNGIGDSSTDRSDAFVVKFDGSVIINSTKSGTTPSLQIGPDSKAITGTTGNSSSTENDDAIIATKYYVDHFLGLYPEYAEITTTLRIKETNNSWRSIDELRLRVTIQTLSNNYKLINGVAYNTTTGTKTITQGSRLALNSLFTYNGHGYHFEPSSSGEDGYFILNLPVSQMIFGYMNFTVGENMFLFCQRNEIYTANANFSYTDGKKVWLQIINLFGTFTPLE